MNGFDPCSCGQWPMCCPDVAERYRVVDITCPCGERVVTGVRPRGMNRRRYYHQLWNAKQGREEA